MNDIKGVLLDYELEKITHGPTRVDSITTEDYNNMFFSINYVSEIYLNIDNPELVKAVKFKINDDNDFFTNVPNHENIVYLLSNKFIPINSFEIQVIYNYNKEEYENNIRIIFKGYKISAKNSEMIRWKVIHIDNYNWSYYLFKTDYDFLPKNIYVFDLDNKIKETHTLLYNNNNIHIYCPNNETATSIVSSMLIDNSRENQNRLTVKFFKKGNYRIYFQEKYKLSNDKKLY